MCWHLLTHSGEIEPLRTRDFQTVRLQTLRPHTWRPWDIGASRLWDLDKFSIKILSLTAFYSYTSLSYFDASNVVSYMYGFISSCISGTDGFNFRRRKKTLQLVSNIIASSLLIALSHKSLAPEFWLSFQHQVLHPWISLGFPEKSWVSGLALQGSGFKY